MLSLLIAIASARADTLEHRLATIELPEIWVKVAALAPNVYMAMQPGEVVGKRDESYLTIQSHALEGKVGHLRKQLESDSIRPGSRFGEWNVLKIQRTGDCFALQLENKRRVEQEWCFNSGRAFVVTESGPRRLELNTRKKFRAAVTQGEPAS